MNAIVIGKKILFWGLALTVALFISHQILIAHTGGSSMEAVSPSLIAALERATESASQLVGKVTARIADSESEPVDFAQSEVQKAIAALDGSGRSFAYLAFAGQLYLVDRRGCVLGLADSVGLRDVPIIHARTLRIRPESLQLADEAFKETLDLLRWLDRKYSALYAQLSDVEISRPVGLIAHFNWVEPVAVVFGRGDVKRKARFLHSFYKELGNTRLVGHIRYLDLRLDDRIILKARKTVS